VLLAALAWLTLRDPRTTRQAITATATSAGPSVREVCAHLWATSTFRHLLFCYSVWYFFGYGVLQWQPTFFVRSHGLETGVIGTWFAVIYGVAGGAGVYFGGRLATRYAACDERRQLLGCALAFVCCAVFMESAFLARNHYVAFAAFALSAVGGGLAQGPMLATIQTLVSPRMRAMSLALIYFFANLIGFGLGPLTAGALSDALQPRFEQESLRYALLLLCPGYLWAAWHLWRASKTVAKDMATAHQPGADVVARSPELITAEP
jgi:MFS family permease